MIFIETVKAPAYDDRRYIYISYIDSAKKRFRMSARVTVKIKDYDFENNVVLPSDIEQELKNLKIQTALQKVVEAQKLCWLNLGRKPFMIELQDQLKKMNDRGKTVLELFDEYLEYQERRGIHASTMRKKYSMREILIKFQHVRNRNFYLKDITMTFAEELALHLTTGQVSVTGRPLVATSVQLYLSELSTFMAWARIVKRAHDSREHEDFLRASMEYLKVRPKKKVSLSHDEWMKIYNMDVSIVTKNKRLVPVNRKAVDASILAYLLGRRINEIVNMKYEDMFEIEGRSFFSNVARKTNAEFLVPVNDLAKEIIARQKEVKNGYVFDDLGMKRASFMRLTTQILKKAVKAIDMDRPVTIVYGIGNKLIEEASTLSKEISVHCARGDFGNRVIRENMGRTDVDMTKMVQKLLGHSDIKTTQGYLTENHAALAAGLKKLVI